MLSAVITAIECFVKFESFKMGVSTHMNTNQSTILHTCRMTSNKYFIPINKEEEFIACQDLCFNTVNCNLQEINLHYSKGNRKWLLLFPTKVTIK